MENSKVKALFFAQYLGQKVKITYGKVHYIDTLTPIYILDGVNKTEANLQSETGVSLWYELDSDNWADNLKSISLLLRTVDQLTDEELKVVRDILGTQKSNLTDVEIGNYCTLYYSYLRLIGMLLPFTYLDKNGKPQTLQPDEIIKLGWAKTQQP